jgi:hypothetical protein
MSSLVSCPTGFHQDPLGRKRHHSMSGLAYTLPHRQVERIRRPGPVKSQGELGSLVEKAPTRV